MNIPLCDLTIQNSHLKEEIVSALASVIENGQYILGENVKSLEKEVAQYTGCEYAVGVNSGTDALYLSLLALGIGPGDEVVTSPFTFIASSEAIRMTGATPVFVDIDPRTYNLNPDLLEQAITTRTKAILPIHLYGQSCDMDAILDVASAFGVRVVEDCAQSFGAKFRGRKLGSLGDVGCFSFFPSKNLGGIGDGGMVVTDDDEIFQRVEMLRRHGGRRKYHHDETGVNSRLDEVQAAVLRIKLGLVDEWNRRRRERAYEYNRLLAAAQEDLVLPLEIGGGSVFLESPQGRDLLVEHVYHQYTISAASCPRDTLIDVLKQAGIGCAVYYPVPLHIQKVNADLGYRRGDFPYAEQAAASCLSLPMFPELTADQQTVVAGVLLQYCKPCVPYRLIA